MLIIVEDVNDNSPVFRTLRSSTLHLSEFAKPGTIIETVEAIDQDEGRFGQVTYSIEVSGFEQQQKSFFLLFNFFHLIRSYLTV